MKREQIHIRQWVVMAMGLLLLASCGTKRKVTATGGLDGLSESAYLCEVMERSTGLDALTAKMKLTAKIGGEEISVGGSVKMKKDEAIQLSLVAIGIVEAARIEITPERMLVLDRLGRRYVEVSYADLPFFRENGVDFYTLQALFRNELFLPGVRQVGRSDAGRFGWERDGERVCLTAKGEGGLTCSFLTVLANGLLQESRIEKNTGKNYRLRWTYDGFETVENRYFPTRMTLALQGSRLPLQADLHFSRLQAEADIRPLTIPKRYQRMEAEHILKILTKQ